MEPPFFILGFGRSGTTLLASMISMNPEILIPVELSGLFSLDKKLWCYGNIEKSFNFNLLLNDIKCLHQMKLFGLSLDSTVFSKKMACKKKTARAIIECFYESLLTAAGKRRIGDKTIRHTLEIDSINHLFPDCKIIHMVRDGRDCALSHRTINPKYNVYLSAKRWRKFNDLLLNFGANNSDRYMLVKYEEFISDPLNTLKSVCAFLHVKFSEEMLHYQDGSYAKVTAKVMPEAHANLVRGVVSNNVNKWATGLSGEEVKIFENVAGVMLSSFGYSLCNNFNGYRWRWQKFMFFLSRCIDRIKEDFFALRFIAFVLLKRILGVYHLSELTQKQTRNL